MKITIEIGCDIVHKKRGCFIDLFLRLWLMKWANIQHLSSSHFRSNFVYFWQSKMARFWAFYSNEHLYRSEIDTHTHQPSHTSFLFFFSPSVRGRGEIWWYIYRPLDERTGRSLSCVRLPMCSRLSPSGKTDYTLGLTISFSLLFHIYIFQRSSFLYIPSSSL